MFYNFNRGVSPLGCTIQTINMDYSKFTTTFLILVAFISCCPKDDDFHHYKITFYNNSDNDIYVNAEWCYPDTVYRLSHKSLLSNPEDSRVAAHGIN